MVEIVSLATYLLNFSLYLLKNPLFGLIFFPDSWVMASCPATTIQKIIWEKLQKLLSKLPLNICYCQLGSVQEADVIKGFCSDLFISVAANTTYSPGPCKQHLRHGET